MLEKCANCGVKITEGSTFKAANRTKNEKSVAFVNLINRTDYPGLCDKCGDGPLAEAYATLEQAVAKLTKFTQDHITDFPMFTSTWLPATAEVKFKNMITANVTIGTGFFNELSQELSDMVGAASTNSGMSYKVNKGEATARSILVAKARSLRANCVIAVDIDYGTTANNAATINMQGTAAVISNLESVMHPDDLARAQALDDAYAKIAQLHRWRKGDIDS